MNRSAMLLALVLAASPARASDWLGDLFGADGWTARARGNLATIAARYVGKPNFTGFRGPWCAVATSQWLEEATGRNPRIFRARDFARFGHSSKPVPGAIVVWPHHVAILGENGAVISGNGRGHRVTMGRRSLRGVIAVRAP